MDGKQIDTKALKELVDLPTLVSQWVPLQREGDHFKGLCPFHPDKDTPSLAVYKTHYHCYGCGAHGDVYGFLEGVLEASFPSVVTWLSEHVGALPLRERNLKASSRQGPPTTAIPMIVIEYWHNLMDNAVRTYYHSRLFTDDTIDKYRLGWNGTSYVLPVWEGPPGESDVYGVRFRRPNGEPRYYGLRGRNQPRLFNKWILGGSTEAFVFFGEFDALLAAQDGFAAVSPTAGQDTWLTNWYRCFDGIDHIYIVPDVGELTAGYRIADGFGSRAWVGTFPDGCGKDYTEFRQNGFSAKDFRERVLVASTVHHKVEPYWEGI